MALATSTSSDAGTPRPSAIPSSRIGWFAKAPTAETRGPPWTTLSRAGTLRPEDLRRPPMAIFTLLAEASMHKELLTGSFAGIWGALELGRRLTTFNMRARGPNYTP